MKRDHDSAPVMRNCLWASQEKTTATSSSDSCEWFLSISRELPGTWASTTTGVIDDWHFIKAFISSWLSAESLLYRPVLYGNRFTMMIKSVVCPATGTNQSDASLFSDSSHDRWRPTPTTGEVSWFDFVLKRLCSDPSSELVKVHFNKIVDETLPKGFWSI